MTTQRASYEHGPRSMYGELEQLIDTLTDASEPAGEDVKVKAFIRLMWMIDNASDDDKPMIVCVAIEYAFNRTKRYYDCFQEFIREMEKGKAVGGEG